MTTNYDEPDYVTALRDSVRKFVAAEMPREKARAWDRDNHWPREVHKKLADLGVFGLTVPEAYGGMGPDIYGTMAVIEELAKRSTAVACSYIMAVCYAGMNIVESGSEAQRAELLPVSRAAISCSPMACRNPMSAATLPASRRQRASRAVRW